MRVGERGRPARTRSTATSFAGSQECGGRLKVCRQPKAATAEERGEEGEEGEQGEEEGSSRPLDPERKMKEK